MFSSTTHDAEKIVDLIYLLGWFTVFMAVAVVVYVILLLSMFHSYRVQGYEWAESFKKAVQSLK